MLIAKGRVQKPQSRKMSVMGVPPTTPLPITESGRPKSKQKKVSGKGGYPYLIFVTGSTGGARVK